MNLVINADDFGLTKGVSLGILHGIKHGIITDTSAIVNTCAFEECTKLAIEQGIDTMGIHLLLTMGEPVLPKEQVPSLLTSDNRFCTRKQVSSMNFHIEEVRKELHAQITKFLQTGLKLNHIDTHHGFMNTSKEMAHLFIELSQMYGVPLRNEASLFSSDKVLFDKQDDVFKTQMVYFNHGTPHHCVEDIITFLQEAHSQYDCVEIGCHPGYSDDELRKISVLNDDREIELAVFTDKRLQEFIKANNITLTNYTTLLRKDDTI